MLPEGDFSIIVGDAVSSRPLSGRELIALACRIAFGEESSLETPSGVAAEAACVRSQDPLFGEAVSAAAGEATSPGGAVAPAVSVTSVPAVAPLEPATAVRGPGLTP